MSRPDSGFSATRSKDDFGGDITIESQHLTELTEQKNELLAKVQTMKKELQDWRNKLDNQVKCYRGEISDLRKTLNTEVESLRSEFLDLKSALKQQLELTAGLAAQEIVDAEQKAAGAQPI
mmetsp:Transcript_82/g.136  ORF Transcript_82/g.136 Transcript_82/m.136 type:complete len:121 (-) Transcript_82:882-1244(-)|eukprot:CAMPEP_0202898506 /NCGR_PEP_ID=MMETSP1392-20130828/7016_1 /ASSEMBLY_ACC=CAM_ASM_000868 /TAXON_ID=225041 /ORGANISM="Chlamydomonas chlamydogama, Strain SAG 11-48b" /LENGTH=120 /DNA_ID=CAMNT_0049584457 /DNA_START=207 /DNA_END=569 /DNA_ORIENTATION=-